MHIAIAPTPWDWMQGEGHTLPLSSDNREPVLRSFREQTYLKCSRFLSFHDPEFREGRVDAAAFYTFQTFEPLILA